MYDELPVSAKDLQTCCEHSGPSKRAKLIKNPSVDTSFLPDRDREENERRIREELRQKWLKEQETVKAEEIEVTYSYWDGSGHRKSVTVSAPPKRTHLCGGCSPYSFFGPFFARFSESMNPVQERR